MDDYTCYAWDCFLSKKSNLKEPLEQVLTKIQGLSFHTSYLRCDNAGKNIKHLTTIFSERGIIIEMTAPHTLQINGVVERSFVTARDRAFAMMISARLSVDFQNRLWAEAVHTAIKIDNILPSSKWPISPHMMFLGMDSKLTDFLQPL